MKKWTDLKRQDLSSIPMMEEKGFKTIFSYYDKDAKRTIPDNPPHMAVNFEKGDLIIWSIKTGWQTAYLIGSSYMYHKPYKTLEEASERLKEEKES